MVRRYTSIRFIIMMNVMAIVVSLGPTDSFELPFGLRTRKITEFFARKPKEDMDFSDQPLPMDFLRNKDIVGGGSSVTKKRVVKELMEDADFLLNCMNYGVCKYRYLTTYSLKGKRKEKYLNELKDVYANSTQAVTKSLKLVKTWEHELDLVKEELAKGASSKYGFHHSILKRKKNKYEYLMTYAHFAEAGALNVANRYVEALIKLEFIKKRRRLIRGLPIFKVARLEHKVIQSIIFMYQHNYYGLLGLDPTTDDEKVVTQAHTKYVAKLKSVKAGDEELEHRTIDRVIKILDDTREHLVAHVDGKWKRRKYLRKQRVRHVIIDKVLE